jgi:hypothetical protein
MQQSAELAGSPNRSSFAALLAALAAPASAAAARPPAWSNDGLEDDVATLSYERALRAHARYRSADLAAGRSLTQPVDSGSVHARDELPSVAVPAAPAATPQAVAAACANAEPETARGLSTALDRNLKCASITIRLSNAECAQLRKRAAEAGLTVSAYLRSCTFEAESLRALVKDTLSQLRLHSSNGTQAVSTPPPRSLLGWCLRFLPRWHSLRRVARA